MGRPKKPEGAESSQWLEIIKAIGPYLVFGTIIFGIWRFQVEREQEAAARYLNIIKELGDDSNSVRAGAVITMETYLKKGDTINKKYREQGIYVLATHLAIEPIPLVRATTEEALVNIGEIDNENIVVRKLVSCNRHLWEQEKLNSGLTAEALRKGNTVDPKLQSVANTLIQIFQRRNGPHSRAPKPLDLSDIYLTSDNRSLENVNLVNVHLDGACLVRANFQNCTMKECNLRGAYLDDAILREATLTGTDFEGAHLGGAKLERARLQKVMLRNAELAGAVLRGAELYETNLEAASLERAILEGVVFKDTNLQNAHLEDSILEHVNLQDVNMVGAFFNRANLTDANLAGTNLEAATLSDANLQGAHFTGANMTKARLERANLREASLENANLNNADLGRADLRGAHLTDANVATAILQGADLEGAMLEGANLENADLRTKVLFSIDSEKFQSDLQKGVVSEDLQQESSDNGIYLSQNTTVTMKEKDHKWLIDDKDYGHIYTVRTEEQLNICTGDNIVETELCGIDPRFQRDLDNGALSGELQKEFGDSALCLSQNAAVSVEEKDRRWCIDDKDYGQTYTVKKENGKLKIYERITSEPTELFRVDAKKFQGNFDKGMISQDFRQEFSSNGIDLSQAVSVEAKDKGWLISDKDNKQTYLVKKEHRLNVCEETRFNPTDIQKARNWNKAIFDDDKSPALVRSEVE
jgi:uncharacterized protein YjbI with pentapeptide repeats